MSPLKYRIYKIPGKTFIFGEYSALLGGAALILNHKPCFSMAFSEKKLVSFHPQSPAGKYLAQNNILEHFEFTNPYAKGGVGSSTAEFLGVYALSKILAGNEEFQSTILEDYLNLFSNEEVAPSGYDLLAQLKGGLCSISNAQVIDERGWTFKNCDLLLFNTFEKVATHEHLKSVKKNNFEELKSISGSVLEHWLASHLAKFINELNHFSLCLEKNDLVVKSTAEILNKIRKQSGVLAAKGCGALGADTVLVIVEKNHRDNILALAQKLGLLFLTDQSGVFKREEKL